MLHERDGQTDGYRTTAQAARYMHGVAWQKTVSVLKQQDTKNQNRNTFNSSKTFFHVAFVGLQ